MLGLLEPRIEAPPNFDIKLPNGGIGCHLEAWTHIMGLYTSLSADCALGEVSAADEGREWYALGST